jgi:hypothetical protein
MNLEKDDSSGSLQTAAHGRKANLYPSKANRRWTNALSPWWHCPARKEIEHPIKLGV